MRMFQKGIFRIIVLAAFMDVSAAAQAGMAVIAHPTNSLAGITQEQLAKIYLGKTREFSDGKPVIPVDQREGSVIRNKFYKTVTDKGESAVKAHWSKLLFTGKAQPPRDLGDDDGVKAWVAKNPEGLGYVDGKVLDKSVKVLLILP